MIINSPLRVKVGKKWFSLNMNQYRNAHFQTLNKAKKNYGEMVYEQVISLPKVHGKISIEYGLYVPSARRLDVANVCSIIDKFFSDELVKLGRIHDDDYKTVVSVCYKFCGIDRDNPRCEISISSAI